MQTKEIGFTKFEKKPKETSLAERLHKKKEGEAPAEIKEWFELAEGKKPEASALTNTEILCFVLGWQGGTIHQVALALSPSKSLISSIFKMQERILTGTPDDIRELCRLAQRARG